MRNRAFPTVVLTCFLAAACGPFSNEEVSIRVNEQVTLAGTLTVPDDGGPFPAVILISGSGWQTRDSDLWGFKVYREIAHHLAFHEIAVLRCDDRGVGRSTGNPSGNVNTTLDFADDVLAQVAYLKSRPEVDPARIGLLGQSEGAIVASMVDARSDDIGFTILVAAPALPLTEVLAAQLESSLLLKGLDEETVATRVGLWRQVYDALINGEPTGELREALRASILTDFDSMSPEERERKGNAEEYAKRVLDKDFKALGSRWGRFLLGYDPRSDHEKMDSRVLALYGGKDSQVSAALNAPALEESFRAIGKEDYSIEVLEEANHLFQRAVTGSVSEYAELPREFVPGYLEAIVEWAGNTPTGE
jgi:pimeloyl-ACP methyl ester carboxylesterase